MRVSRSGRGHAGPHGPGEGPRALTPKNIVIRLGLMLLLGGATLYALWWHDPRSPGSSQTRNADLAATFNGQSMGTTWVVKVVAPNEQALAEVSAQGVQAALDQVDQRMSTWKPDSELSRFNRHQSPEPFPLSRATVEVLAIAGQVWQLSGGAFDVTVEPLVELWGFNTGARENWQPPSAEAVKATQARVGHQHLHLTATGARKDLPTLTVDLSAVAKGYAVDQVAQWLQSRSIFRYMVEVGGEVRLLGTSSAGEPWRIGVESPLEEAPGTPHQVLHLTRGALATSGTYRNFQEVNGRRLSHMIDPRTGHPVEHNGVSVSVYAETCALADAWATALLVLGPEAGFQLALQKGVGALFLAQEPGGALSQRATPLFPSPAQETSP